MHAGLGVDGLHFGSNDDRAGRVANASHECASRFLAIKAAYGANENRNEQGYHFWTCHKSQSPSSAKTESTTAGFSQIARPWQIGLISIPALPVCQSRPGQREPMVDHPVTA